MRNKWISVLTSLLVLGTLLVWVFVPSANAAPVDFAIWNFDTSSRNATTGFGIGTYGSTSSPCSPEFTSGNPDTGKAWCLRSWATTQDPAKYFDFQIDLTNYGHIKLSFDEQRSSTGPTNYAISYSTDGINFSDTGAAGSTHTAFGTTPMNVHDFGSGTPVDLAIRGQSTVHFRIYAWGATTSAGTWRLDNVTFNASTNPTAITVSSLTAASPLPAALPVLGLVVLGGLAAGAAMGISAGLVKQRRG